MKKVVRLSESDLTRLIKRVISEQSSRLKKMAQYVTENDHILTKNGKTIKINKGDIWRQKGMDASMLDFMVHEKTGITFLCDPSLGSQGFMSDEKNLYKFQNARPLVDSLRVKFCKGRTFNYDNYVSTECIRGLKSGREGFEGCNEMR
jgi:hypothetical protein